MKRREELNFFEKLYIFEILKGVAQTSGDLFKHLFLFLSQVVGFNKNKKAWATYEYPDEARPYADRFRGRHRLTLNDDGSMRCTACYLCSTACPASCIHIDATEHEDPEIEKFPNRYEIDTLLCIYCGYCVEACPVDAIRMDTGIHPEIYPPDPRSFIEDKETLMKRSRVLEDEGPDALFKAHMKKLKAIETKPFEGEY